jgi:VIT1/CCC1 family predicted Fe2+/Mn2+ transporter
MKKKTNHSVLKGFSFGLTSGVVTTLGMIVGLETATKSYLAVVAGILSIAIADACSDAFGMHVSEESEAKYTGKEIWTSTLYTFIAKFIFAIVFIIPFIFFDISTAVLVSIVYGIVVIAFYSYHLAKKEKIHPLKVVGEHLLILIGVVIATYLVGKLVDYFIV